MRPCPITVATLASGLSPGLFASGSVTAWSSALWDQRTEVSHLALGTMTWGVETDADEAAAQLVTFHDAGGTLVDTAASYGYGETEELLGQLLADVVPRPIS